MLGNVLQRKAGRTTETKNQVNVEGIAGKDSVLSRPPDMRRPRRVDHDSKKNRKKRENLHGPGASTIRINKGEGRKEPEGE